MSNEDVAASDARREPQGCHGHLTLEQLRVHCDRVEIALTNALAELESLRALRAPAEPPRPDPWQPITTAPQDTPMLAGEIREGHIRWMQSAILRNGIWRLFDFEFALDYVWVD